MAFRFGDPGGRIYTSVGASNANLLAHWTSFGGTSAWSVLAAGSRHDGGSCLRLTNNSGQTCNLRKTLDAQPTWGIAFAYRFSSLTTGMQIAGFEDGTATQVDLRLNIDGTLTVTRNGTVLATSTNSLSVNTWYHIELKATIHITAGNYEVRVNGTSAGWIPAQGGTAVTRATTNNSANGFRLGGNVNTGANTATYDYDDVIVYDQQATDPNGFADIHDFIGDKGLYWLLPTGAGTTTQWTPDTGSNYARVNEATPDGDTSYVSSSTVGQIDTYTLADLPAHVANVVAVAAVHYARKDDVGARGMKSELRSAGANAAHATEIALANGYLYYFQGWGQDPNAGTPAAWTVAAVNALEMGENLSS